MLHRILALSLLSIVAFVRALIVVPRSGPPSGEKTVGASPVYGKLLKEAVKLSGHERRWVAPPSGLACERLRQACSGLLKVPPQGRFPAAFPPSSSAFLRRRQPEHSLQVERQRRPDRFARNLGQASRRKSPQFQLRLDPGVGKLRQRRPFLINRQRLRLRHLRIERFDRRIVNRE